MGGNGEPDIRERPFEELPGLEDFNAFYRNHGGAVNTPTFHSGSNSSGRRIDGYLIAAESWRVTIRTFGALCGGAFEDTRLELVHGTPRLYGLALDFAGVF
jgi:hypothetical protein